MKIGEAARASGISAKMIRYYESISLLPPADRSLAGYRHYSAADLRILLFIRHARDLGFSLDQIGELLALWQDKARSSADVKRLAESHIATLEDKAAQLLAMSGALRQLADQCCGDARPDCPILEGLGG